MVLLSNTYARSGQPGGFFHLALRGPNPTGGTLFVRRSFGLICRSRRPEPLNVALVIQSFGSSCALNFFQFHPLLTPLTVSF
jgi:hypothetical protein